MNIFRILASGRAPFKEEAASAFLAYLLSPKMDHGLGPNVLAGLLRALGEAEHLPEWVTLAEQLDTRLREDLFGAPGSAPTTVVTLEQAYSAETTGFIDVVIRCGDRFIAIENKVHSSAFRRGQVEEQYRGLRERLAREGLGDKPVLMLYVVPALWSDDETWTVPQIARDEIVFATVGDDRAAVIPWQPIPGRPSIVGLLRDILHQESLGDIPPMSMEVRQCLLALIDFALGEFQGYPYERAVERVDVDQRRVCDLLGTEEEGYVGIQHGMAGIVRQAWRKPTFGDMTVPYSETPRGWQYVPLADFQILAQWAMHPDEHRLDGVRWTGKPFATPILYVIAKAAGPGISIGVRGGLAALDAMSAEEIRTRKGWEVTNETRNSQWFSGTGFCEVLERKGIKYDGPAE